MGVQGLCPAWTGLNIGCGSLVVVVVVSLVQIPLRDFRRVRGADVFRAIPATFSPSQTKRTAGKKRREMIHHPLIVGTRTPAAVFIPKSSPPQTHALSQTTIIVDFLDRQKRNATIYVLKYSGFA